MRKALKLKRKCTLPNRKCPWKTVDEEISHRQKVVEEHAKAFRSLLPCVLEKLKDIPDPRDPKLVEHKIAILMLYGILMFVLQMSSRREASREMSRPQLLENLRRLFPELEDLPHHDTLNRLLGRVDVERIQEAMADVLEGLIKNKKFRRYMVGNRYLIAIDGTQKFSRDVPWASQSLKREVRAQDGSRTEHYVYALEASLVFSNGIVLPLHTEFLERSDGEEKQDCEIKAFRRMAAWIKGRFPRLPIAVLLDGLYPNGPVMSLCRSYGWEFMIVLKDDALPSVWEEAKALNRLEPSWRKEQTWGDRRQRLWWANHIEHDYGPRQRTTVHVVVCEEEWEEVSKDRAEAKPKKAKHAWVSSEPLTEGNVHRRCNLMARHRWAIENQILVEKRHGYSYEHCFSYDWNAMKGFHYLMRLAHLLNALAQLSIYLADYLAIMGARGLVRFLRETLSGPWVNEERIRALLQRKHQLRFT